MASSARRPATIRWARAFLASAAVLALAAFGLVITTRDTPADGTGRVAPAVAAEPPDTIEPRTSTAPASPEAPAGRPTFERRPTPDTTPPDTTPPTPPTVTPSIATTVPASPLSDLLGESGSAIPPDVEARVPPTELVIDDIGVHHPVRPVGLEVDGQLEVPDETEIGWYRYGAAPGRPGATVLAAHVTWNRNTGPFLLLRDVTPGSRIDVALADGSVRTYEAVERTVYDKDELPTDRIWRNSGDEVLVLITCGGDYNPDIRRYRQNVVVYAVPVAQTMPTPGAGRADG